MDFWTIFYTKFSVNTRFSGNYFGEVFFGKENGKVSNYLLVGFALDIVDVQGIMEQDHSSKEMKM